MSYKALANVVGSDFIVRQGDIIPDGLFNTLPDFQKSRFQKVAKTVNPAAEKPSELTPAAPSQADNQESLLFDGNATELNPESGKLPETGETVIPWPVAPPDPEGHVTDNPDRQYLNKQVKSDKPGKNKGGK